MHSFILLVNNGKTERKFTDFQGYAITQRTKRITQVTSKGRTLR